MATHLKWVIYAAVLLTLYAVVLPPDTARIPDGIVPVAQAHRIVAEDLQLQPGRLDAVVLGSSLSHAMPAIALSPIRNLALTGGSPVTGAMLLRAFGQAPRIVLIEANVLDRPADEALLSDVLQPMRRWVVEHCRACRNRNRPVTVALTQLSALRTRPLSDAELDSLLLGAVPAATPQYELLEVQIEGSTRAANAAALDRSLGQLAEVVAWLQGQGSRIVFIDMPMHRDVAQAPYNRSVLAAVSARFPENRFEWIHFRDRPYMTSDGHHLIYPEARAVAQELSRRVAAWLR